MGIPEIVSLFGGAALFLFGMTLMGDGLKKVAGNRLELVLYRLSGTPLKGLLLGTGVTGVIQSSCATAVMTVGFVNAGMMKLERSVYVILGAILGTSVTGWVICLSYIDSAGGLGDLLSTATLTGIVAVAGILLRMFTKTPAKQHVGDILMGFAVLMFGMSAMSGAVANLGKAPWFLSILTGLSNPILGILAGTVFTAALQSASAAVGIVQALSLTGVMDLSQTIPLLLGIAIGASAPVLLSAVGAGTDAKRASLIYPVSGVIGVAAASVVFYSLNAVFHFSFLSTVTDPFSVAAANSAVRLAILLCALPLSGVILKLVEKLVKDAPKAEEKTGPQLKLETRFLAHPALAVEQSRETIEDMANLSKASVAKAIKLLTAYSKEGFDEVAKMEDDVDVYEDRLGTYLMELTGREMSPKLSANVTMFLRSLTDFERISDHARNLGENAREMSEKAFRFSDAAAKELSTLCAAVREILSLSVRAFNGDNVQDATLVEPLEQRIDDLCDEIGRRHVKRLQGGDCTYQQGFVFNDILTNLERIADHCSNLAVAVIEQHDQTVEAHAYLSSLKADNDAFAAAYEEYAERYTL